MGPGTKAATTKELSANKKADEDGVPRGRLLAASSQVSRAVARSQSREDLLQEAVRALVEAGGFAAAFVSLHDPATGELVPVSRWGDPQGQIDRVRSFAGDSPQPPGSAGTAFSNGLPSICNDLQNEPRTLPWRETVRASGWLAAASFPIITSGTPCGALTVLAPERDVFGGDQIELLEQIALDLAFGMERLDAEERQRQAQAASSTREHHLKLAMDAAELGTWDWDLGTGTLVWDGHHERIFGFEPEEFNGTYADFERRIHPEDLPKLNRAMETALVSRDSFCQEFRVLWPDGSEHWIFGRGVFHYNEAAEPYRMCGAVMDVTERKRVEAALRESEERLRQAVRVSDIGIFDHDHINETLYWSPELRAMNEWDAEAPVPLNIGDMLTHPEDFERIREAIKRSHDPAGDGLFDIEYRIILPSGALRWTSTRAQTYFAGEGEARHAVRTVGAVRDITEEKRAAADQRKLATLVAMSRDFIGIATLEGRVVYANHAAMGMVGLSTFDEACQKTIFEFFGESERAQARETLFAGLLKDGYWAGDSRLRHFQTGKAIDVEVTAFQMYDDNGAPLFFATVMRDITEKKRTAAEKARLEEQLFQAQKMESIGRLAGGVAHDFNNLLTVINGYSGLLLSDKSTGSPRSIVGEIQKAGESAAGLTRQLLAFSRKQALEPRTLDLNREVEAMRPMLERLVGEDVEIDVKLRAGGANVHADPHQLQQVIMNLVANARDAMPGGGRLKIETAGVERDGDYAQAHPGTPEGRYIMLTVSDTGAGIDAETQQLMFEPFFTTKGNAMGTGLGLSTVQGIVTQSGGHIEVRSEPGKGTAFHVCLPALDDSAPDIEGPPAAVVAGGRETVLVVEDQEAVREFTVAALSAYGYRALAAENAREALAIGAREERIDLLLTDVVMPNLNGQNLADELRKHRPAIKVLFMSGYNENHVAHRGSLDPYAPFIQKPFSPEELAGKVRDVLGPGQTATGARILVADDQEAVRGFLRMVLEERGYEVFEAADGKDAFREALAQRVDLITTDLNMLEQDGLEAMRALRSEAPGVGLIAISGMYEGNLLEIARGLGADAVLSKPVSAELLLATVASVLKPAE